MARASSVTNGVVTTTAGGGRGGCGREGATDRRVAASSVISRVTQLKVRRERERERWRDSCILCCVANKCCMEEQSGQTINLRTQTDSVVASLHAMFAHETLARCFRWHRTPNSNFGSSTFPSTSSQVMPIANDVIVLAPFPFVSFSLETDSGRLIQEYRRRCSQSCTFAILYKCKR